MRWLSKDTFARVVRWNVPITNRTALLAGVWAGVALNVTMIPAVQHYVGDKPDLSYLLMGLAFCLPLYLFVWETSPNPFFPDNGQNFSGNWKRTFIWFSALSIVAVGGAFLQRNHATDERIMFAAQPQISADHTADADLWEQWKNQLQAAMLDQYENSHFAASGCKSGTHGVLQTSIDDQGVLAPWHVYASSGCALLDQHMLRAANAAIASLPPSPRRRTLLNFPFESR